MWKKRVNGWCFLLESSQEQILSSQLLPKLDQHNYSEFGREMEREESGEETVRNLMAWLITENNTANRKGNDNETYPQQQQQQQ